MRPTQMPIGLALSRAAKTCSRAFDDAMAEAGGSLPTWLVLLSVKTGQPGNQREMAEAIGIRGATLTHHLNAMERDGLLSRRRDPENRRVHQVELTDRGEEMFRSLVGAATGFDRKLRAGLTDDEMDTLRKLLARLADNATS